MDNKVMTLIITAVSSLLSLYVGDSTDLIENYRSPYVEIEGDVVAGKDSGFPAELIGITVLADHPIFVRKTGLRDFRLKWIMRVPKEEVNKEARLYFYFPDIEGSLPKPKVSPTFKPSDQKGYMTIKAVNNFNHIFLSASHEFAPPFKLAGFMPIAGRPHLALKFRQTQQSLNDSIGHYADEYSKSINPINRIRIEKQFRQIDSVGTLILADSLKKAFSEGQSKSIANYSNLLIQSDYVEIINRADSNAIFNDSSYLYLADQFANGGADQRVSITELMKSMRDVRFLSPLFQILDQTDNADLEADGFEILRSYASHPNTPVKLRVKTWIEQHEPIGPNMQLIKELTLEEFGQIHNGK